VDALYLHDVRVRKRTDVFAFALERSDGGGIARERVRQDLDRDLSGARAVLGQPDFSASARPQAANQDEALRQPLPALAPRPV
jgi:hypothetical protein